jgi:hypothetical protein
MRPLHLPVSLCAELCPAACSHLQAHSGHGAATQAGRGCQAAWASNSKCGCGSVRVQYHGRLLERRVCCQLGAGVRHARFPARWRQDGGGSPPRQHRLNFGGRMLCPNSPPPPARARSRRLRSRRHGCHRHFHRQARARRHLRRRRARLRRLRRGAGWRLQQHASDASAPQRALLPAALPRAVHRAARRTRSAAPRARVQPVHARAAVFARARAPSRTRCARRALLRAPSAPLLPRHARAAAARRDRVRRGARARGFRRSSKPRDSPQAAD